MTGVAARSPDLPGRENGEKAGDARPDCEHYQLVCVQLGNVIDRHVRLSGQGFDGALVRGAFRRGPGERSREGRRRGIVEYDTALKAAKFLVIALWHGQRDGHSQKHP